MKIIKRIAARLPDSMQLALRRFIYRFQIWRGTFTSPEMEYHRLAEWVRPGDYVVDMGANVGHFTVRLSSLVGRHGRVFAFEPMTTTFTLLALATWQLKCDNVTLINAAIADRFSAVGMGLPTTDAGLPNFYMAQIEEGGDHRVIAMPLDSLGISHKVSLIKIDVEGHEGPAIDGAKQIIARDKPVLIVETRSPEMIAKVEALGYRGRRDGNSPNVLFEAV